MENDGTSAFSCLAIGCLVTSLINYIKQGDWVEMWAKALRADYLPSVNVKAVKATFRRKGRKQLDKAIQKRSNTA